ncbi:15229_t:CDS:10, partial [Acaulospora morrowiae]
KDYLHIDLETGKIIKKDSYEANSESRYYDIYGVVGLLELLSAIHLIVITERKNLGKVQGKDVYMIKRVAILPLDYDRACKILEKHPWPIDDEWSNTEGHQRYVSNVIEEVEVPDSPQVLSSSAPESGETPDSSVLSLASEPLPKKQPMSVFFSKMKSTFSELRRKRSLSLSSNDSDSELDKDSEWETVPSEEGFSNETITKNSPEKFSFANGLSTAAKRMTGVFEGFGKEDMTPKTINIKDPIDKKVMDARVSRELANFFQSESFFFSYELDITVSLQKKHERKVQNDQPLWKQVEKRFWWNEHLLHHLIELELHEWILPIMQGFVQTESCVIEDREFDFTLISRRSRDRAGLRYQRRGVDEHGNVANYVETEQIIAIEIDHEHHDASFLQVRGSKRSAKENSEAFSKHFESIIEYYGDISCINLVETTGREATIGSAYQEEIEKQNNNKINYIEFDFHKECKGMKYENISNLISKLDRNFSTMKYFWQAGDEEVHCKQEGIFRTNCMDCLDRTNVVQSALAREVLNLQLLRFGLSDYLIDGISHYEQFENIFNEVWANNGDSISKEYAGTSALKGKRNLQGVVNDASNSIARLFQNNFKDFFRQAMIDYLLGNHSIEVFQELQQKFEVSQPGDADRWAKVRTTAIEISSSIVIADEEKINGWTFLSPNDSNTLRGRSYEEKVLLLTKKALYVCTFHYKLEKVIQFKRIGLGEITLIEKGEYILSTLYPSCVSLEDNYGFVVYYMASGESIGEATKFDGGGGGNNTSISGDYSSPKTSQQVVNEVVGEIVNACWAVGNAEDNDFVVERPIISLEEANKNTGIMTKVGFKVKQALWL